MFESPVSVDDAYVAASTKCMGCFSSVIIFVDLMCTTSPVRRKGHRLDGAKLIFFVLFFFCFHGELNRCREEIVG
jgi:hypothetical protein